jgi:two-component system cell cycle response regulator
MVSQAQSLGRNLSVIMVDIDHFKKVNDDYGHQAGDAVLKEVSRRLELGIRTSDMSSRFGGEEFVIVLPETNGESAGYVAERLRMIIEDVEFAIPVEPKQITCTASFGVASLRPDDTAEGLIKRADTCLYKAKESGRNKYISDSE